MSLTPAPTRSRTIATSPLWGGGDTPGGGWRHGGKTPGFQAQLRNGFSRRITVRDEKFATRVAAVIHLGPSVGASAAATATNNHTAAEGLSSGVAQLRRTNRYAAADFFGQCRFRSGQDR